MMCKYVLRTGESKEPSLLALIARERLGGIQASELGSHLAGEWAGYLECQIHACNFCNIKIITLSCSIAIALSTDA